MGRVRTNTVKKAARHIIEKYYPRLTTDFHVNKRIAEEVAVIPSKRLRNKIAGYLSHLMKRIEKGPVRGISFKLQEEERERRDNYVPETSEIHTDKVVVDPMTFAMLKGIKADTKGVKTFKQDKRPAKRPVGKTSRQNKGKKN